MIPTSSHSRKGISLVELSIVLVIIGLLISGIVYGVNMVQRAKMLKVGEEFEKYTLMMKQFRDIYRVYPGLMENAFDKWGTNCAATAAECNCFACVNSMYYFTYSPANTGVQDFMKVWRHLWLAGFLEKETQVISGGGYDITPGIHVPASSFNRNSGFLFEVNFKKHGALTTNPKVFEGTDHILNLGLKQPSHVTADPLFTPTEALYLYQKNG